MVKALEKLLEQDAGVGAPDTGSDFHLFADSGENIYIPGEKAVESAEAIVDDVFVNG